MNRIELPVSLGLRPISAMNFFERVYVRFTPESGHAPARQKCPLSAKSGHQSISAERPQMIEFTNNLAVEFSLRQTGHLAL